MLTKLTLRNYKLRNAYDYASASLLIVHRLNTL